MYRFRKPGIGLPSPRGRPSIINIVHRKVACDGMLEIRREQRVLPLKRMTEIYSRHGNTNVSKSTAQRYAMADGFHNIKA